jgi:HEAT repeat protein
MTEPIPVDRANDPRTIDELISAALSESDESAWGAVCALHWKGTAEVFDRAAELCRSECPQERTLGVDILGQLGVPNRSFPDRSISILLSMLEREEDAGVLQSILVACSHIHDQSVISVAARFSAHVDSEVRHAVVLALTGHDDPMAVETLIGLSKDSDAHVRDWATFGLGTQIDVDTPEICDALAERLTDPDFDTRHEAFVGLARRRDQRVVAALAKELNADTVGTLAVEAAEMIRAPALQPQLIEMREWWDVDPELLERAIAACSQV